MPVARLERCANLTGFAAPSGDAGGKLDLARRIGARLGKIGSNTSSLCDGDVLTGNARGLQRIEQQRFGRTLGAYPRAAFT